MKKVIFILSFIYLFIYIGYISYGAGSYGTDVEYIADSDSNRNYVITVPAKINPKKGESVSSSVVLSGAWASDELVKVTADNEVVLTNKSNNVDKVTIPITFSGMEFFGNDSESKSYENLITVGEIPSSILFGEWTGRFNYNVEFFSDIAKINIEYFDSFGETNMYEMQFQEGMTWEEWVNSSFNTVSAVISSDYIEMFSGYVIDSSFTFVDFDSIIDLNSVLTLNGFVHR